MKKINFLLNYGNKYNKVPSSNCFHAVYFFFGFTKKIRYVGHDEFKMFLKDNFSKINNDDNLRFGDVIVIFNNNRTMIRHAFIYLDHGNYFQKSGPHKNDIYEITTLKKIFIQYGIYNFVYDWKHFSFEDDINVIKNNVSYIKCFRRASCYPYVINLNPLIVFIFTVCLFLF